jgi:hypothetical protein
MIKEEERLRGVIGHRKGRRWKGGLAEGSDEVAVDQGVESTGVPHSSPVTDSLRRLLHRVAPHSFAAPRDTAMN